MKRLFGSHTRHPLGKRKRLIGKRKLAAEGRRRIEHFTADRTRAVERKRLFGLLKSELLYLQEFQSMGHFKQELTEYPDYCNNRRIKAKLKGLPPAIHRQQALSVA